MRTSAQMVNDGYQAGGNRGVHGPGRADMLHLQNPQDFNRWPEQGGTVVHWQDTGGASELDTRLLYTQNFSVGEIDDRAGVSW